MARSRSTSPASLTGLAGLQGRLGLWPVRVLWLTLPLVAGNGLSRPLRELESPGQVIAEVGLWAAWFAGLVAALVPSPVSLTAIRTLAPGAGALVVAGALAGDWSPPVVAAIGFAALVTIACHLPVVGDRMINGSAYGSERRMALRPPGFALLGPVQLAWGTVFAGVVSGPGLLAGGHYLPGIAATAAGAAVAWLGFRVLHQLSRRWIVFVPAGFVIHDHVSLVESVLLRRSTIAALGPAPAPLPAGAVDLTAGARGLALMVQLSEPVTFGLRQQRQAIETRTDQLVLTPTLPGAVLVEARTRAIRIGSPASG
jgi:hypothetical protein